MPESSVSVGQKIHAENSSNGSSWPAFAQILVRSSVSPQISFGICDEQCDRLRVMVREDGRARVSRRLYGSPVAAHCSKEKTTWNELVRPLHAPKLHRHRPLPFPRSVLCDGSFWDFGSLYQEASRRQTASCCGSGKAVSEKTLRRPRSRLLRQRKLGKRIMSVPGWFLRLRY